MTKTPPVPKGNRSPHRPGERARVVDKEKTNISDDQPENPDQQGQAANTRQNLIHQGNRRSSGAR